MSATITSTARHAATAHTPPWVLTLKFVARLQWRYLARFPSNHAWMVLRRKYDAFATDHAYENQPSSWLGPFGRWADRRVLDYPVHIALRQRLGLVTAALSEGISTRVAAGDDAVRVLSAPSGLCRDLIQAGDDLRDRDPHALDRVDLHCLDIDAAGDVFPKAQHRLEAAQMTATFHREDIFAAPTLRALTDEGSRFQLVNCIGLASWISLDEVARLGRSFHELLEPGGSLLIDNFAWHDHSAMGADLEINTIYHPPAEFVATIEDAGFRIDAVRTTANRVGTLYVATAV